MKEFSYKKTNLLVIIGCLFLIGFLSVGYSILTSRLNVNSMVTVRAEKDIRITNISAPSIINGAYEQYDGRYTVDTVTTNIGLPNLDSQISYDVTITNNGNTPMEVSDITMDIFNNDKMTYTLSKISKGTVIAASNILTFKITYQYKNSVTSISENIILGNVLKLTFKEYTELEVKDYIKTDLAFDLRGTSGPVDNNWVDLVNGKSVRLDNVTYDSKKKLYDFSNGYGTLGEALIPETGDFTLEAYVRLPVTLADSDDKAIVSQISDTNSKDSGRFKLNLKSNSLVVFANIGASNVTYPFFNNIKPTDSYLIQLVRKDGVLQMYANGIPTRGDQNYSVTNKISQGPFKLGRWIDSSTQHYDGSIYAVRLYNRALTAEEINNNYVVDLLNYTENLEEKNLFEYAISEQIVTSDDGLYKVGSSYIYKGVDVDNYIRFFDDNNLYRIISFNDDGTLKLIDTNLTKNIPFDISGNRTFNSIAGNNLISTYCDKANSIADSATGDYYGCNYWNTTSNINDKVVQNDSSIKQYIDSWYNGLDDDIKKYIVEHDFDMGLVTENIYYNVGVIQSSSIKWRGNVGLISVVDLVNSLIQQPSRMAVNNANSYLAGISDNKACYWTMNGKTDNTYDVWTMCNGNQISSRRASRYSQLSNNLNVLFYALPSFYINSDCTVIGSGTISDPFIITK